MRYDILAGGKDIIPQNSMVNAHRSLQKALFYDKDNAGYAMGKYQERYDIAREARENRLSPKQSHGFKPEKSLQILNDLGK